MPDGAKDSAEPVSSGRIAIEEGDMVSSRLCQFPPESRRARRAAHFADNGQSPCVLAAHVPLGQMLLDIARAQEIVGTVEQALPYQFGADHFAFLFGFR